MSGIVNSVGEILAIIIKAKNNGGKNESKLPDFNHDDTQPIQRNEEGPLDQTQPLIRW